jgi:hypothetical protein
MATDSTLSTSPTSGSQTTSNSNLQAPPGTGGFDGGTPSTIQPVISGNLLDSKTGIPLAQTSLSNSTVALGATSSQKATIGHPKPRHINPGLLGFSIALFVFAIALFWFTGHAADKKTTI